MSRQNGKILKVNNNPLSEHGDLYNPICLQPIYFN